MTGCSVDSQPLSSLAHSVSAASHSSHNDISSPAIATTEVAFEPRYPDRVDPFRYPGEESAAPKQKPFSIDRATGIEILGFADLDQPKAILRSNDHTYALAVGESRDGIEVMEINPPSAKLKSGNLTWAATMFDKAKNESKR